MSKKDKGVNVFKCNDGHKIYDSEATYDKMFVLFAAYKNLKDGDAYNLMDYVRWLNMMKMEFAQWANIPLTMPFTADQYLEFEDYLKHRIKARDCRVVRI